MLRVCVGVLLLMVCASWVLAADNPVVGTWDLVSTGAGGEEMTWKLVVKEDGGKLSGTLTGDPGEFPLVDPKLEGNKFTFQVTLDQVTYSVESKVSGKKLEGTYKGSEAEGKVAGTKQG